MRPLTELLHESGELHGHLCPGQVLGVRMAMLGCQLVGVGEPMQSKELIVFVEIDRCATVSDIKGEWALHTYGFDQLDMLVNHLLKEFLDVQTPKESISLVINGQEITLKRPI